MSESADASVKIGQMTDALRRGEVVFALGIMCIITVLILPMPKGLLDVALALSLLISILVLTVSLFIAQPLDFSSFPTLLLVTTMLRLSLNVASTRLILSNGHEGLGAAGDVIRAFGKFVMSDNFVIGLIVFSILVLVNFVVITKGSGRIAEVSARFSLDSMPGKQMAIDADLSAGLIDETEARTRRKKLEDESNFYGAMDGAAKFVRGDAIAGLCITCINIIGGIIIGVVQKDMSASDAAHAYTLLTVGDGLVSQIPALIVSTAAGMLVSKAGAEGSADKALFGQLGAYPAALGVASVLMGAFSLLPGIPMLPFVAFAFASGAAAWKLSEKQEQEKLEQSQVELEEQIQTEEVEKPLSEAMQIDQVRLELGYGLLSLVNDSVGQKLTDQIKALRKQLARELGFILPTVRIQDNLALPANTYVMRVKEIEVGQGELRPHMLLVMDPQGSSITLAGEPTIEPTFGLKAMWINHGQKRRAEEEGYTIVDPMTVITTHLSEAIKDNASELLSFNDTQKLLDDLPTPHQKLIKDIVPSQISSGTIQRVLQSLLIERVSVRDLEAIIEGVAEVSHSTKHPSMITEHVRSRLARQICASHSDDDGVLPLITISSDWEQLFRESLIGDGESKYLGISPTKLQEFTYKVRDVFDGAAMQGHMPVLLTSAQLRPHIRQIIERFRASTIVMSQNEIHPKAKIKTVGTI